MAKQPGKNINLAINSVALEGVLRSAELKVEQETIAVAAFADVGPRKLVGNYDFGHALEGDADFATGSSDATLFGLIGNAGVTAGFDPTGAAAPAANDPHYDGTVVLKSYSLKGAVGAAVTFSAELEGNSALTRAVA